MTHFAGPNASPPATSPLAGGFAAWAETGDVTGLLAAADWLDEQTDAPGDEWAYTPFAERAAWLRTFATYGTERFGAHDERTQFFYGQCGYCGDGRVSWQEARARGAIELARAEQWAEENCQTTWQPDEEYSPDDYDDPDMPQTAWGCVVSDSDGELASLWAVTFDGDGHPDGPYKRLVDAELALELMPDAE